MMTPIKTLEQAIADNNGAVYKDDNGRPYCWFDPIINFYVIKGFNCPCCDAEISWTWEGELPAFTSEQTIRASGVKPVMSSGELLGWFHRIITVRCPFCGLKWIAHNLDYQWRGE
jgi:endogenous inhibitor of DNA gyrase (YacG/DUF329 family)